MQFEWDPKKAKANRRKHGISFDEATELFTSGAPLMDIPDTQGHEERFRTVGPIRRGMVAVVWTERSGDIVRIISARFASKREIAAYQQYVEATHG